MRESGIEAFMQEYDLPSEEGVLLMCLAEPLIRDKGDWSEQGRSQSLFVNALRLGRNFAVSR